MIFSRHLNFTIIKTILKIKFQNWRSIYTTRDQRGFVQEKKNGIRIMQKEKYFCIFSFKFSGE